MEVKFDLPQFSKKEAEQMAEKYFRRKCRAEPLPGERDQNFVLVTGEGDRFVLKIAHAAEELSNVQLQDEILAHLQERATELQIPRVCTAENGESIVHIAAPSGKSHFIRMLTYIPARLYANVRPHSKNLLFSLGEALGILDSALQDFESTTANRKLKWDPAQADWIREYLRFLPEERRALVQRVMTFYESEAVPLLSSLRKSVIYNDANDYNILVSSSRVVGFIDFGDAIFSATVCDPAVAIAYAMLGMPDPLGAAVSVLKGFHSKFPLREEELAVLFPLACARLCITATNAAYQKIAEPQNAYLTISENAAWSLLKKLEKISGALVHSRFRFACGFSASRYFPRAAEELQILSAEAHRIVETDLKNARILDLRVENRRPGGLDEMWNYMTVKDGDAAIGRYDEMRVLSASDVFRKEGNEGPEWRTVHLGVDIFLPPGSPVFAPLDAQIHSFHNNSSEFDYGPTVILQHKTEAGHNFYTLFGHLSLDSLSGLREGQIIKKGERIATIGSINENGKWPPHVHFQIITDMLEMKGDFPGNATPEEQGFWLDLCPDPGFLAGTRLIAPESRPPAVLLQIRSQLISNALSISYREPLYIVRGHRQFLYDTTGRAYLDCVNNVAHVGHCHPRVVKAGQKQMSVLNTNTRYLHESILDYASRLLEKFPEPLRVCFFVNSGSEANELALRLARVHTGAKDLIVLESGYHGNTTTLIDLSHYKFTGPGGHGAPDWVHVVPLPDPYRGLYKGNDADTAARYAQQVAPAIKQIEANAKKLCGFLAESMPGVAGQIVFPSGYLQQAYRLVREAGGVCIADEVQTGFGRPGTHFWAFETQHVIPDIVTLGKPIGNGHPIGAVITSREIAASFSNGMEYFNTFGGNPVSCEIGLAVLEVLQDENLQNNAASVGNYLMQKLDGLKGRFPLIGNVRGCGLYIGIELVEDRGSLRPAPGQAEYIANRLRERAILLSTDGPLHNVLKIKPPMVFSHSDADFLFEQLEEVLEEDEAQQQP